MNLRHIGNAAHHILDEGLSLLDYQHLLALVHQSAHQLLGQRILRNLQHGIGAAVGEVLHDVVVADAAGKDAQRAVATLYINIVRAIGGIALQLSLLGGDDVVALLGVGRQQHPVGSLGVVVQGVLLARLVGTLHDGTRVGHAGGDAHQHGHALALAVVEGGSHHVVSLLLRGGLEGGYHGELAVEARILLVLRRVHRGVVGHQHHHAAVDARHAAVDEGVGTDVQSHVLHAHQGSFAHVRHAESGLHGSLLVR